MSEADEREARRERGPGVAPAYPVDAPVDVLYEDEALVAVSKPGGLLVHRSRESDDRVFLLQMLGRQIGAHLFPIHRLDRAASGVIVFGKSSEAARDLQTSITDARAVKEYLVLVRGSDTSRVRVASSVNPTRAGGPKIKQPAHSEFRKLAEFSRSTLLVARIFTGRRHQIRRHLAHEQHQVLGDTSYGKGKINQYFRDHFQLPRLFLHAWRMTFAHPRTGVPLTVQAPLAPDLRGFLERLGDVPAATLNRL